jgi:hypothetical protein
MLLLIILLVLLFPAVVDTTAILAGALEVDSESSVRSWSSSWCCICSECCAEPRTCRNTRKIPLEALGPLYAQVHDRFVAQATRLFFWRSDRTRWQRALLTVP